MLHYVEAIRSHGTADGYNTEVSEKLHIDNAKEGYCASNKKDYIKQMTVCIWKNLNGIFCIIVQNKPHLPINK